MKYGNMILLLISQFAFSQTHIDESSLTQLKVHAPKKVESLYIIDQQNNKKAKVNLLEYDPESQVSSGFVILRFNPTPQPNLPIKINSPQIKLESYVKDEDLHFFSKKLDAQKYQEKKMEVIKTQQLEQKKKKELEEAAIKRQKELSNKLRLEAEQRKEKERLDAETKEALRREQLLIEQQRLSQIEKEKRIKKAALLAEEALEAFKKQKYQIAEKKFSESIQFDPENNKYYFQYGVSLYKNEKYSQSLLALNMADAGDFNLSEKYYYSGLNHMKLKEFDKASDQFAKARDENDVNVSPMAAYLNGLLKYQDSQLDQARSNFEFVLDNSNDPHLDKEAEKYLDEIDAIEAFNQKKSKKFNYSLLIGPQYDSNILNLSTQNTPLNVEGVRLQYGATFEYRPIYLYNHEWSINTSLYDMYTWNTSFGVDPTLQKADPLMISISSPYKYKTKWNSKPFQITLTPGYEMVNMNADGVGAREQVTSSYFLKWDNNIFSSNDLNSSYSLEYRQDTSLISSAAADNQTATKYTLGTTQIYYLDIKKTRNWEGDAFYALNQALGSNQSYNKISLAATYAREWLWNSTINGKLEYVDTTYPTHSSSRKDNFINLSSSASKPINEKWTASLSLTYSIANSNITGYSYNKINISNVYTYAGAF